MSFHSGLDFEEYLFGPPNEYLLSVAGSDFKSLGRVVVDRHLNRSGSRCPRTYFSESLYSAVALELGREMPFLDLQFDPYTDLFLFSTAGSQIDWSFMTDAFMYLKTEGEPIVTMDALLLRPNTANLFKDYWSDFCRGGYTHLSFQNDLYRLKILISIWRIWRKEVSKKEKSVLDQLGTGVNMIWSINLIVRQLDRVVNLPDAFKDLWESNLAERFAKGVNKPTSRPPNHFVVVPSHVSLANDFGTLIAQSLVSQIREDREKAEKNRIHIVT